MRCGLIYALQTVSFDTVCFIIMYLHRLLWTDLCMWDRGCQYWSALPRYKCIRPFVSEICPNTSVSVHLLAIGPELIAELTEDVCWCVRAYKLLWQIIGRYSLQVLGASFCWCKDTQAVPLAYLGPLGKPGGLLPQTFAVEFGKHIKANTQTHTIRANTAILGIALSIALGTPGCATGFRCLHMVFSKQTYTCAKHQQTLLSSPPWEP